MDNNCIFCDIVNKKINSVIVYEDNDFIGILDKFPTAKAHILVIPKLHQEDIFSADDKMLSNVLVIAKKICNALKKMGYNDINILQNNGSLAGQSVFHYHVHIIPREISDNVKIEFNSQMQEDEVLINIKDEILKYI